MLNEISQSKKDKYCTTPSYEVPIAVQLTETERRMVVAKGKEKGELMFNGYKVSVLQDWLPNNALNSTGLYTQKWKRW